MVPGILTLSHGIRTFPSLFSFRCLFLFLFPLAISDQALQGLSSSSSAPALKASAVTTLADTLLSVVFNIFHTSHFHRPLHHSLLLPPVTTLVRAFRVMRHAFMFSPYLNHCDATTSHVPLSIQHFHSSFFALSIFIWGIIWNSHSVPKTNELNGSS